MNTLFITIDTEADTNIQWKKPEPLQFTSVTYGIPKYLRPIWDKYGINPIYFVSYEVLQDKKSCAVLKSELRKGAVIGTHLHPEYINSTRNTNAKGIHPFPCIFYNKSEEKEKIEKLTEEIVNKLSVKPIWYRAARVGADRETIDILEELGYKYDSSVTPCINWSDRGGPDHRRGQCGKYYVNKNDYYRSSSVKEGIVEYPITISGKRFGILGKFLPSNWLFYRWLRPSHMTYLEERTLIKEQKRQKNDLVMMFHSMEIMVKKNPFVRSKWMQKYYLWRLEKTIEYALKEGYSSYSLQVT